MTRAGTASPYVRMRQAQRDGGGARVTSSRHDRIPAAEPTASIAIFTPSPPASAMRPALSTPSSSGRSDWHKPEWMNAKASSPARGSGRSNSPQDQRPDMGMTDRAVPAIHRLTHNHRARTRP